jgi:hypothetical protein
VERQAEPKWITIYQLELMYCDARGTLAKPLIYSVGDLRFQLAATYNNPIHHEFCVEASQAGFSGILRFQGKVGDAKKAEGQMGPIPETYFCVTRGFEDNVIMPFSYGLPIDEQIRQRNSKDPYFHDVIVEREGAERWLAKRCEDGAPAVGSTESGGSAQESRARHRPPIKREAAKEFLRNLSEKERTPPRKVLLTRFNESRDKGQKISEQTLSRALGKIKTEGAKTPKGPKHF